MVNDLIDPVHKKTAFLQQVKAQLQLDNLTVINGKVEDLPTELVDLITSRAFSSLINFVQLSEHVLQADGCFAAMKGVFPSRKWTPCSKLLSTNGRLSRTKFTSRN